MTRETILKLAIEKAVKNGWVDNLSPNLSLDWYFEDNGYYGIIFSKDFLKAFYGERNEHICQGAISLDPEFVDKVRGWQYHGCQQLLSDDPILYLQKYL